MLSQRLYFSTFSWIRMIIHSLSKSENHTAVTWAAIPYYWNVQVGNGS